MLQWIEEEVTRLRDRYDIEVVIIDDGSTDGTENILETWRDRHTVIRHERNQGLAAVMRTGFARARGDFILIQHADLEYHPRWWGALLAPLTARIADIVAGSRYHDTVNPSFKWSYRLGGRIITSIVNVLYGVHLTDVITAAHAFRRELLDSITFTGEGFAFESELTCRALRRGLRVQELPIDFTPRSFAEGKKIRWHHIFGILKTIIGVRFDQSHQPHVR